MLTFMQEIKKENKSLEDSYEGLEFIQEACKERIAEGMKEQHVGLARCLANVEELCQGQADIIAQKNQVLEKDVITVIREGNKCR